MCQINSIYSRETAFLIHNSRTRPMKLFLNHVHWLCFFIRLAGSACDVNDNWSSIDTQVLWLTALNDFSWYSYHVINFESLELWLKIYVCVIMTLKTFQIWDNLEIIDANLLQSDFTAHLQHLSSRLLLMCLKRIRLVLMSPGLEQQITAVQLTIIL